jgi:hypothetical protein
MGKSDTFPAGQFQLGAGATAYAENTAGYDAAYQLAENEG